MPTEAAVKERPILMCGAMVRQTMAGKKTQTRRIFRLPAWADFDDHDAEGEYLPEVCHKKSGCLVEVPCPYGVPGDLLYVKEAAWMWCERQPNGKTKTGRQKWLYVPLRCAPIFYCADGHKPSTSITSPYTGNRWLWRWKASRFLPRWACRTVLKVTDVRIERLQDITETEAMDEGAHTLTIIPAGPKSETGEPPLGASPRERFRLLWDELNKPRGYGWDANPFVWVVSFKRLES